MQEAVVVAAPQNDAAQQSARERKPAAKTRTGRSSRSRAQALAPRGDGHGRPSVLSDEVQRRLVDAVSVGCSYEVASRYAGIGERAIATWREMVATDNASPLTERARALFAALENAEAAREREVLAIIAKAAITQWQAGAWYLERKYPERFGRRDAVAVGVQGEVRIIVEHVTDWHARDVIDVEPAAPEAPRRGRKPRELDGQPGR